MRIRAAIGILCWLAAGARAAPTFVSLTFDDARVTQRTAKRLLDERGLKATFFVNTSRIGGTASLSLDDLRGIFASGHEIGGHTRTHPDLTTVSDAERQRQVCDDRASLVGWGFDPVSFAYPYGAYNAAAIDTVRTCGYLGARIIGDVACSGCPKGESVQPADAYAIRAPGSVRNTTTLAALQKYVTDLEAAGGGWMLLTFHTISDGPSSETYSIDAARLAEFMDWLKARESRGTLVRRVRDVLGAPAAPGPTLTALSPSSAPAGGPDFTLGLAGSNFTSSSTARWNGASRATTFVSSTSLRAAIPAGDIASAGTASVSVFDAAGGLSDSLPFAILATSSPTPPSAAFFDDFAYPDGLITNENAASPRSPKWLVTKGSLFASDGQGWTGVPDAVTPNATSSNGTGSALFRALTQPSGFATEVTASVTVGGFPLAGEAWDGAHIFLRYQDSGNYYYVTVRRRDGRSSIKRKRGGRTTTFTTPLNAPPLGVRHSVRALAVNQPDGSVLIELYANGTLLARAVDGTSPITASGKVGIAGENADFRFDDFTVGGSTPAAAAPLPPDLFAWAKAGTYLHDVSIDTTTIAGRRLLRLSTAIANKGRGALELRAIVESDGTTTANQRIFDDQGGFQDRFAGTFEFSGHGGHNHFHVADFADYRLRAVTAENGLGPVVAASDKVGFAMFDNAAYDLSLPGAPGSGVYARQEESSLDPQGISVGWADVYDRSLGDQWIDVTTIPAGSYWIEVRIDPRERLVETDETNNTTWVKVLLSSSSASTSNEQPGGPAAPVLNALLPSSATAGGPAFTLSVFGAGFSTASVVEWNGAARTTTFVSGSTLTAAILAADIASSGAASVTVGGPAGRSNALAFTVAPSTGSPPPSGFALFEPFDYPDGLITNENAASPRSDTWLVIEGSLFASGGQGWTGVPDAVLPDATSSNGTGSALFRALTRRSDFATEVTVKVSVAGFPIAGEVWDGVHVFLRYQDPGTFYQVSLRRRDGRTAIKKKRAGVWSTFTTPTNGPPLGAQRAFRVRAVNQADGSVLIELYSGETLLARAVDASSPLLAAGRVGIGGDKAEFHFDEFGVAEPGGATVAGFKPPPPAPPAASTERRVYPNPWRGDRHAGLPVTFAGLAPGSVIRLYSLAGRLLRTMTVPRDRLSWDLADESGARVGSGYFFYITTGRDGTQASGILAIVK